MTGSNRGSDPGRPLRCEESRILVMGYIDGELDAGARERLEDHLALCGACRSEEAAYRRLGEVTESALSGRATGRLPGDDPWPSIYRRIERNVGWLLMGAGLTLLLGFGMWQLLYEFLLSSEEPLVVRLGVGGVTAGTLVLLVSFIRDRLRAYGSERYREIIR